MVDEIDIWRTANLLIQHHGTDAELEASRRADGMIEKGDLAGEAVWKCTILSSSLRSFHLETDWPVNWS